MTTEENNNIQEPVKGNPDPNAGKPTPQEPPKPSDRGSVSPNPDDELKTLREKHDTLKRQYGASSEEALRLKGEVEELREQISKLRDSHTTLPVKDEDFQALVGEVGWAEAIKRTVQGQIQPIAQKTEELYDRASKSILDTFKTNHPGLKDEVLAKFDKEFARLKNAYDDAGEAMEKAYLLVGGLEADKAAEADRKVTNTASQSEEDKQRLIANASGNRGDRVAAPLNPNAELTAQISRLQGDAMQAEALGRDATALWTKITELQSKLAVKTS